MGTSKAKSPPAGDVFLAQIKRGRVPAHVAIIMDGNGRWARQRGLPRLAGHRAGVEAIKRVVEAAHDAGVRYLTLYAFSTENWRRPKREVAGLMRLLKETVQAETAQLAKNHIRLNIIGRWGELPADLVSELEQAVKATAGNKRGVLNLALNYSGQAEIVDAVKGIVKDVQAGRADSQDITPELFERYLYTAGLPVPDLLIRSSGELRVSNFLLWQIAYTEIWVTPVLWPAFTRQNLFEAIAEFQKRRRRYGAIADV